MDKKVLITINNKDGTIDKVECDGYKHFRLLWFDEEGYPHVYGKLPLRMFREPSQDGPKNGQKNMLWGLRVLLKQYRSELTPEEIVAIVDELRNKYTKLSEQRNGNRNNNVAYYMAGQFVKAISDILKKVAERITTIWEFPESNTNRENYVSIHNWLFRR